MLNTIWERDTVRRNCHSYVVCEISFRSLEHRPNYNGHLKEAGMDENIKIFVDDRKTKKSLELLEYQRNAIC